MFRCTGRELSSSLIISIQNTCNNSNSATVSNEDARPTETLSASLSFIQSSNARKPPWNEMWKCSETWVRCSQHMIERAVIKLQNMVRICYKLRPHLKLEFIIHSTRKYSILYQRIFHLDFNDGKYIGTFDDILLFSSYSRPPSIFYHISIYIQTITHV